jgi:hypothetical protein
MLSLKAFGATIIILGCETIDVGTKLDVIDKFFIHYRQLTKILIENPQDQNRNFADSFIGSPNKWRSISFMKFSVEYV